MNGVLLNPWMLLGLAALAAPVIAHLVHRQERQGIPFPSLMFLRRVPLRVRRQRRVRDPWLLALRCLLLAAIVLAFADPRWLGGADADEGESRGRDVVLLLDRSYSMDFGERWSEALTRADAVIESLSPEDRAALVVFDVSAEVVAPFSTERESLRAALATLSPGRSATDFAAAMAASRNLFAAAGSVRREVVLLSDLQRAGFDPRPPRLADDTELTVHASPGTPQANVALVSARVEDGGGGIVARLWNSGRDERVSTDVLVRVDGLEAARTPVVLDAGEERDVAFPLVLASGAATVVEIEIGDDALAADNAFNLVAAPAPDVRALVVEPDLRNARSGLFMSEAMSLSPSPRVDVRRVAAGALDSTSFEGIDLLAFVDVAVPGGEVGLAVDRYVEEGGGLLLLGPGGVDASGPAERDDTAMAPAMERRISELSAEHPVFEAFAGASAFDLSSVSVYRHDDVAREDGDRVIARLDNGAPAVLDRARGDGRAVIFTTSLDESWSTLALDPAFPPLIIGVVKYLTGIGARIPSLRMGEAVDLRAYAASLPGGDNVLAALDSGDALIIETPSGARDGASASGLYTPSEAGVHEIHGRDTRGRGLPLAVNADRRESGLGIASVEEFREAMVRVPAAAPGSRAPAVAGDGADSLPGSPLAWYLLAAALAVAFLESFVSTRMDRWRGQADYAEGSSPELADR